MTSLIRFASFFLPLRVPVVAGCALALAGTSHRATPVASNSAAAPASVASPRALPSFDWSDALLPIASWPVDWSATAAFAFPDLTLIADLALRPAPRAGSALTPPAHGICAQVAFVARTAALEEARADYMFAFAKCLNQEGGHGRCLRDLQGEYREAVQLAREQYEGRLDACELLREHAYRPGIDPSDFSHVIDNAYLPLVPGRTLVYRKQTAGGAEETRVTTLRETVVIGGVRCAIVRDVVRIGNELVEDTDDWFAQHRNGDVWYMGELARNYEDGMLVDLDGSWRAGVEGALPGIQMRRMPCEGAAYRQEFLLNEAEDIAEIVGRGRTVTVPAGTFRDCLQTEETTPLEPDAEEQKYYAVGVGLVLAVNREGERTELVEIIDP